MALFILGLVSLIANRPRWPELPPRKVDLFVAAAVLIATVWPVATSSRATWWTVPVAVLGSVPLAWRRSAPLLVGGIVGLAITALAIARVTPPMPYGTLVAVYTVAASESAPLRVIAMIATAAGVTISLIIPNEQPAVYGGLGIAFSVAYALGAGTRARRMRIEALEERAARLEEERASAAARERTRIARDMHDVLTHSVGLMVAQAEAGPVVLRADPERAERAFDAIADTGRAAIGQLRQILTALRAEPEVSREPQPGVDALPGLLDGVRRTGLVAELTEEGERRSICPNANIATFRIVQEALTNTVRHARAGSVRVSLRWTRDELRVSVEDDGRGGTRAGGGHGLAGMRERAVACGGTLTARSTATGFAVTASLPIG